MAEIAAANTDRHFLVPIHWSRAIGAGVVATVIMTIVGAVLKMNFPKMIGSMIVPHASLTVQYAVGGAMHFMIGIVYGIIYAALVGRLMEWNRFVKGVVYGLAITAIALAAMPLMSAMIGGGGGAAQNPCHPQTGQQQAMNPCHPQGQASAMNPCHPKAAAGNPCNPCGGGSSPYSGVMSVVNHLIYALTLAFAYGKVR